MEIPIYYKIRFKLLAYNNPNDIQQEVFENVFKNSNPIVAREEAFKEFEEYLGFLKTNGRIENIDGNFRILQKSFVKGDLEKLKKEIDNEESIENRTNYLTAYSNYLEEIKVVLVIEKNAAKELNLDYDLERKLYQVSSGDFDPQELLDGLNAEIEFYNHFQFDKKTYEVTIEYYGTDYYESGRESEAAFNKILSTPFVWSAEKPSEGVANKNTQKSLSLEEIIKEGEGNQIEFKPTLLYNFKTSEAGIGIKYLIAKTICAFLNSNGGILFIGITNDGKIQGLDFDYSLFQENHKDKLKLEFDSLLSYFFSLSVKALIDTKIIKVDEKDIYVIQVRSSDRPVLLRNKIDGKINKEFFIRLEASTRSILDIEEITSYIFNKWLSSNTNE